MITLILIVISLPLIGHLPATFLLPYYGCVILIHRFLNAKPTTIAKKDKLQRIAQAAILEVQILTTFAKSLGPITHAQANIIASRASDPITKLKLYTAFALAKQEQLKLPKLIKQHHNAWPEDRQMHSANLLEQLCMICAASNSNEQTNALQQLIPIFTQLTDINITDTIQRTFAAASGYNLLNHQQHPLSEPLLQHIEPFDNHLRHTGMLNTLDIQQP